MYGNIVLQIKCLVIQTPHERNHFTWWNKIHQETNSSKNQGDRGKIPRCRHHWGQAGGFITTQSLWGAAGSWGIFLRHWSIFIFERFVNLSPQRQASITGAPYPAGKSIWWLNAAVAFWQSKWNILQILQRTISKTFWNSWTSIRKLSGVCWSMVVRK